TTPFPLEHRLVHVWPVLSWPSYGENPDNIGAELGRSVSLILDEHPDVRGLIHSVSYSRSKQLARFSKSPRLILHTESPGDFERALETLFATPRGVLVSPAQPRVWTLKATGQSSRSLTRFRFSSGATLACSSGPGQKKHGTH